LAHNLTELAATYFRYHETDDASLFWAWQEVNVNDIDDADRKWEQILAVLAQARNNSELGLVGAGPLEDLIVNHREAVLDRIEAEAATSLRLRTALRHVWLAHDPASEAMAQRLADMAGTEADLDDFSPISE
jgi:hypothetical protein